LIDRVSSELHGETAECSTMKAMKGMKKNKNNLTGSLLDGQNFLWTS